MLRLKLQYLGHFMRRVDSLEKTLMLGGIGAGGEGDDRRWDGWMASLTRWTWVWVNSRSWWWTGRPGVLRFMGSHRVGHDWATELSWTESFVFFSSCELPAHFSMHFLLAIDLWALSYILILKFVNHVINIFSPSIYCDCNLHTWLKFLALTLTSGWLEKNTYLSEPASPYLWNKVPFTFRAVVRIKWDNDWKCLIWCLA